MAAPQDKWGVQLWDQRARIEQYTHDNIEFAAQTREFSMAIAQVELEYSKQIRKVLKQFGGAMAADNTTYAQAWRQVLQSLDGVAQGHEQTAMKLGSDMAEPLGNLVKIKTKERHEYMKAAEELDKQMDSQMAILNKERAKYKKLEKDEDAAMQAYDKAEKSETMAKGKIEKFRKAWESKARVREQGEGELRKVLDGVNSKRTQYFHIDMPQIIDKMQAMDEHRAQNVIGAFSQLAGVYSALGAHVNKMAGDVQEAAKRHNKDEDSKVFAQLHKSGRGLPEELPLHDKARPQTSHVGGAPSAGQVASPEPATQDDDDDDDGGDAQQYQQIRILYDFMGTNPGELPANAGEILSQVQNDGSGWVLAMKSDGQTQGYVPASYIEAV